MSFSSTAETSEQSDHGLVFGTVYRGAGVAYFVALFVFATAYARVVTELAPDFWGWAKLAISTIALVTVFVRTEWAIFGYLFTSLRRLSMAVVVILGIVQGPHFESLKKLTALLGHWLIWRF